MHIRLSKGIPVPCTYQVVAPALLGSLLVCALTVGIASCKPREAMLLVQPNLGKPSRVHVGRSLQSQDEHIIYTALGLTLRLFLPSPSIDEAQLHTSSEKCLSSVS